MALSRDQIIERLAVELGGDVSQLIASLAEGERETEKTGNKIVSTWKEVRAGVAQAVKGLGTFVTAQAKATSSELIRLAREAIKAADALDEMSERTGVSTEQLSTLQFAANLAGVSIEELEKSLRGLSLNLQKTGSEGGRVRAVVKALGLDMEDLAEKSPDQQLLDVADAFSKIENGADKNAAAVELFGQQLGPKLVPFLNQGREGIEAVQQAAREAGVEVSTNFAKDAGKFEDQLALLEASGGKLARELAATLLPELNQIVAAFISGSREGGGLRGVFSALSQAWLRLSEEGQKALLAVELVAIDAFARVIKAFGLEKQFDTFLAGQRTRLRQIDEENRAIVAKQLEREREVTEAAKKAADERAKAAAGRENFQLAADEAAKRADREAKAIEDLQRQVVATKELSQEETVLGQIRSGAFQDFTKQGKERLLSLAREVDQLRAIEEATKQARDEERTLSALRNQLAQVKANTAAEKERIKVEQEAALIRDDVRRAEFLRLHELIAAEGERQKQAEENLRDAEKLVADLQTLDEKRAAEIARIQELAAVNEEVRSREAELISRVNEKFDEMGERGKKASKDIADEGKKATEELRSGFIDVLLDPVNKGFDDLLANFVDTLKRMAAEALASGLFGGGGKSGGGNPLGGLLGGLGFSGGGGVRGPGTSTSDSIPAWLSNGEFVQPARAVRFYGAEFMEQIRRLQAPRVPAPQLMVHAPPYPRFAEGGLVAPPPPAAPGVSLAVINSISEDATREYLASRPGTDVIFNVLGANVERLQRLTGKG